METQTKTYSHKISPGFLKKFRALQSLAMKGDYPQ